MISSEIMLVVARALCAAASFALASGDSIEPAPPALEVSTPAAPSFADIFEPSFIVPSSTEAAAAKGEFETEGGLDISTASAVEAEPEPPAASPAKPAPAPPRRTKAPEPEEAGPPEPVAYPAGFEPLRGVHLSAWVAGTPKARKRFLDALEGTFLNGVVIALKETDGRVYIPGVAKAREYGTALHAIPDPAALLADVKSRNLKAIARVVVFKDNLLARKRPELGVRKPDGSLWRNAKGVTWVDPYQKAVWEYNVDLAVEAARLGFDEIQFDYVRFPSDGRTESCRYARKDHTSQTAVQSMVAFLAYARERLTPLRLPVSVAIFGMTTTAGNDMGIGQDIRAMAGLSDFISPMMYPSHYARGEYGLKNPNGEPYKVIFRGLRDAKRRLNADAWKLRPYLQDFSMGHRYTAFEVQAQLLAAQKQGIDSWILWNPSNLYTWKALQKRSDSAVKYGR